MKGYCVVRVYSVRKEGHTFYHRALLILWLRLLLRPYTSLGYKFPQSLGRTLVTFLHFLYQTRDG